MGGGLPGKVSHQCKALPYQAEKLLVRADDLGGKGGFDAWAAASSGHCGPRSLPQLLADHWALLARPKAAVKTFLRRMLRVNATGQYSYDQSMHPRSFRLEAIGVKAFLD